MTKCVKVFGRFWQLWESVYEETFYEINAGVSFFFIKLNTWAGKIFGPWEISKTSVSSEGLPTLEQAFKIIFNLFHLIFSDLSNSKKKKKTIRN